jgi:DNA-binding CsgD family transcriptional regulator
MEKGKDFLIPRSKARGISEENYMAMEMLIRTFDACTRVSYRSMYIMDFSKKNFLYVAKNPLFLCGYTRKEVIEMGYAFYTKQVPQNEQAMFAEINYVGPDFFNSILDGECRLYTISYDFNLLNGKKKTLLNHQITPILLDSKGKVWLAACVVSLSPRINAGNVEMRKTGQKSYWDYSFESKKWKKNAGISLNDNEKIILTLAAKGFTMSEMAEQTSMSIDSVKLNRKNLFIKLKVKHITQAFARATTMN